MQMSLDIMAMPEHLSGAKKKKKKKTFGQILPLHLVSILSMKESFRPHILMTYKKKMNYADLHSAQTEIAPEIL